MIRIPKAIQDKFMAAGIELPQVFYTTSRKSQYEGDVNIEFNTSAGAFWQRGENLADAKLKFFSWYLENELRKKAQ